MTGPFSRTYGAKKPNRARVAGRSDAPATTGKRVNVGDFSSAFGIKRVVVWLRRRRCELSAAQFETLRHLAKRASEDGHGQKQRRPESWVIDAIGTSQLPPAAVEWLLRHAYGFTPEEQEKLDAARLLAAAAITRERYVYLPAGQRVFRVADRSAGPEADAVADLQKWYGDDFSEVQIKRKLRSICEQAEDIVRLPGRDARFNLEGRWVANIWTPPPWPEVAATEDDVRPFLDHARYIFGDHAEDVLDWMSAHVQPASWRRHVRWGVIVISDEHQVGKEAIANIFSRVIGEKNRTNGTLGELDGEKAEAGAFLARGNLIVFSEANIPFRQLERLKEVMGSEKAPVRLMQKNTQYIPHGATFLIFSNDPACVGLDAANQRFFVIHHTEARRPDEHYARLDAWEADNGPAKLLAWLRQRDLSAFNPARRPYATEAELELIDVVRSPVVTDVADLIARRGDPFAAELIEIDVARRQLAEGVIVGDGRAAKTYQREVSSYDLRRALKSAGAVSLGQQRVGDRERVSLWALANADRWAALKGQPGAETLRKWGLELGSFSEAVNRVSGDAPPVIVQLSDAKKGGGKRF